METLSLFPTTILSGEIENTDFLSDLEAACWMLEEGDTAGHEWCDTEGYPGYTSYASLNDLPQRAPAFSDLIKILDKHAATLARNLHWEVGNARLVCDSLWVNILGEGGNHSGHIHPGSVLSGTVYIAMPEGSGQLKLEDPRLAQMMAAPQIKPDSPSEAKRFHYLSPKRGDIFMWESWLRHEVMPSRTEEPRISISFNYSLKD